MEINNPIPVRYVLNTESPLLIERITQTDKKISCQLYQGPLCVALGTSTISKKQAIKNAYSQYKRKNEKNS